MSFWVAIGPIIANWNISTAAQHSPGDTESQIRRGATRKQQQPVTGDRKPCSICIPKKKKNRKLFPNNKLPHSLAANNFQKQFNPLIPTPREEEEDAEEEVQSKDDQMIRLTRGSIRQRMPSKCDWNSVANNKATRWFSFFLVSCLSVHLRGTRIEDGRKVPPKRRLSNFRFNSALCPSASDHNWQSPKPTIKCRHLVSSDFHYFHAPDRTRTILGHLLAVHVEGIHIQWPPTDDGPTDGGWVCYALSHPSRRSDNCRR